MLPPPAQRASQVRSRELVGASENCKSERASGFPFVRETAEGPPPTTRKQILAARAPPLALLRSPGVGEHEPSLQACDGAVDCLPVVGSEHAPKLTPRQRFVLEYGLGYLALDCLELVLAKVISRPGAASERVGGAEQARGDQKRRAAEVLACTGKAAFRQLVLPAPEPVETGRESGRLAVLVPNRPITFGP